MIIPNQDIRDYYGITEIKRSVDFYLEKLYGAKPPKESKEQRKKEQDRNRIRGKYNKNFLKIRGYEEKIKELEEENSRYIDLLIK